MARRGFLQTIMNHSATLVLFSLCWSYLLFSHRCYTFCFSQIIIKNKELICWLILLPVALCHYFHSRRQWLQSASDAPQCFQQSLTTLMFYYKKGFCKQRGYVFSNWPKHQECSARSKLKCSGVRKTQNANWI